MKRNMFIIIVFRIHLKGTESRECNFSDRIQSRVGQIDIAGRVIGASLLLQMSERCVHRFRRLADKRMIIDDLHDCLFDRQ